MSSAQLGATLSDQEVDPVTVKLPPAKPVAYWVSASKAPEQPGAAQGGHTFRLPL